MLHAGINLINIRDFLGHATVTTTEIYTRADTEMKRQALERVGYGFEAGKMLGWDRDGELMAWGRPLPFNIMCQDIGWKAF